MDKESVLNWFGSDVDFRVTKVLKQHWYKRRYSYLNAPRPDFGLMLLVRGSVDFLTEHTTVSARAGNLVFLSKHSRYEAVFSNEVEDDLICFDADENDVPPSPPMILAETVDLSVFEKIRTLSDENSFTMRPHLYNKGSFLLLLNSITESARDENDEHGNIVKLACELLQKMISFRLNKSQRNVRSAQACCVSCLSDGWDCHQYSIERISS